VLSNSIGLFAQKSLELEIKTLFIYAGFSSIYKARLLISTKKKINNWAIF